MDGPATFGSGMILRAVLLGLLGAVLVGRLRRANPEGQVRTSILSGWA